MRLPSVPTTALAYLSIHLAFALAFPPIEDEAYYSLWATYPAWGYYDHPPMIAWSISAGEALFGQTRFGLRVLAVLAATGSLLFVADIARRIAGEGAARRAALFFAGGLMVFLLGSFATPDAPSLLFWSATLWAIVRAMERPKYWLLAGAFSGLGLISKFTNAFLIAGALLWLVATASGRQQLRSKWPWLAALIALVVISPHLVWNIQNGWLGLERQGARVAMHGIAPQSIILFVVLLVLLASPVIGWAAMRRAFGRGDATTILMTLSCLPLLAYFTWHAASAPVQANWPLPVTTALAVLASLHAERWSATRVWLATALGAIPALGVLLVVLFIPAAFGPGHTLPNQMRGWPRFADQLAQTPEVTWIATAEYGLTGALAWYRPDLDVRAVYEVRRYTFLPPFPEALCTQPAIFLHRDRRGMPAPENLFDVVGEEFRLRRVEGDDVMAEYRAWPVSGLKACPPPSSW